MNQSRLPACRRGAAVPVVVILLTFLVSMVAFAVDVGYVAVTRTELQNTADAAALAGAGRAAGNPGLGLDQDAIRTEARSFARANQDLLVRDADIDVFRYDPAAPAGSRVSFDFSGQRPNAVSVVVRRDKVANGPLNLFFAPIFDRQTNDVRAKATAYVLPARGVLPGAPVIPYAMQIDYYYAATGNTRVGVDGKVIPTMDGFTVNADKSLTAGADGVREIVLFSSTNNAPGNFGSIDLGSGSNGTPELHRQILDGPTAADFQSPDFKGKLAADGSLTTPFTATGDGGMSTSVKSSFAAILGQTRMVPLYDTVVGSGDGATYRIVGFAAMVITKVDFNGNPKKVWAQPSFLVTNRATAHGATGIVAGAYTPPRLVVP